MAETVTMPKLGFDMAEGTLVRWMVQEGETVEKGAVLAEIETDKATVEVESSAAGVVHRHLVSEGDSVPVGEPIAIVGEPGEEVPDEAPEAAVPEGEPSEKGEAPEEGVEAPPEEEAREEAQVERKQEAEPGPGDGRHPEGLRASPVARRIADEKGIDLRRVEGSGPGGRIVKKDVEAFLEKAPAEPESKPAPKEAPAKDEKERAGIMPTFTPLGPPPEDEEVALNRLRSAIGRRMVEAKQQVPHFYVTHEYEMAQLLDMRSKINAMLSDEEKISVNDFIVKATALALREYPNLNASFKGDSVLRHGQVNIGVAVAVEGGLLTVVNRDTDRKPLRQIAVELRTAVGRARQGKVRPEDIEGSTFSISNMGMFDVEHFIAIINPPEAAILAVGSAMEVPVVKDGEIKSGLRMKATISVDHRVSDGAEAARFMQSLARYLEEPLRLLL
jgi:pyruvate dehydrogenase E2 component (dihydrolipoamide acetyltransferase)